MSVEMLAIMGEFFLLFFGVVGLGTLLCLAMLFLRCYFGGHPQQAARKVVAK